MSGGNSVVAFINGLLATRSGVTFINPDVVCINCYSGFGNSAFGVVEYLAWNRALSTSDLYTASQVRSPVTPTKMAKPSALGIT